MEAAAPAAPSAPARHAVLSQTDVERQHARLAKWERELEEYSASLSEDGWKSWKKGAVSDVMQELQRTVVPDHWSRLVREGEERIASLETQLGRAAEKERGLAKKIELLENGPGCARELQEQLDAAQLQLQQQKARERQRGVLTELLTAGTVAANAGGGRAADPMLRRRASSAEMIQRRGQRAADGGAAADSAPAEGASAGELGGSDALAATSDEEVATLRMALAKAEREAVEAAEEMGAMKAAHEERSAGLESALSAAKAELRHAEEALRSVHLEAGVHEAQEMAQLRMELAAASEELDFLRGRQAAVHEEENRLQMVAQMSRRLGTNVSKFELDSLRSQVASLTQEAERVQQTNAKLQAELKTRTAETTSVVSLRADIVAYQKANDALEAEVLRGKRHAETLASQVEGASRRIELLQRQLVLSHAHRPAVPHATSQVEEAAAGGGVAAEGGSRRRLPLLWDGSPEVGVRTRPASSIGANPPDRPPSRGGELRRSSSAASARPSSSASAHPASASGAVAQRAVELHDEVAAEPMRVERLPSVSPRIATPFAPDACLSVPLADNAVHLGARAAVEEAAAAHEAKLQAEVGREREAGAQEMRVVVAGATARQASARLGKLKALRFWDMMGLMRALCRWSMLLELDVAYGAALGYAAAEAEAAADEVVGSLDGAARRTVDQLLLHPHKLAELGEARATLQKAQSEAERLRGRLHVLFEGGAAERYSGGSGWVPPTADALAAKRARAAAEAAARAVPGSPAAPVSTLEVDSLRLKLSMVLRHWRASRAKARGQELLLRQLSARRNAELELAAAQGEQLRKASKQCSELGVQVAALRGQQAAGVNAVAAAQETARAQRAAHEEEVGVLGYKLRQLIEDRAGLRAQCDAQATDLGVLSQEIARLRGRS